MRAQHSLHSQKKYIFKANIKRERKKENPDSKLQYNKEIWKIIFWILIKHSKNYKPTCLETYYI